MILSIITGTYNRLGYLKQMVKSARESMPPGIEYEIVVTDGGSTDGTLQWMKKQNDIVVIEHGELKGAIAAFNDAARKAKGDFLLFSNDDILFIDKTIAIGLSYMLEHLDVGAGCFYQNRAGKEWHVETLQIRKDGEVTYVPYLQIGLAQRWLCLECGVWGDYGAWTYGGDCYLSAKILEKGYKIEAIPDAKIHDLTPEDELRKFNNMKNDGGKDGKKYYDIYPNGVKLDPGNKLACPLPEYKKILYAPIYEPGHENAKKQKRGLRNALNKKGVVWEVDYMGGGESISEAARIWKPDLMITQLHNADNNITEGITEAKSYCKAKMVNWNGDVWAEQQLDNKYLELLYRFDLQTGVNYAMADTFTKRNIRYKYWQVSFEPNIIGKGVEENCDVLFMANAYKSSAAVHQSSRLNLGIFLDSLPYKVHIYGSGYPTGMTKGTTLYDYKRIGRLIRGAKIVIGDNQFPDEIGFFSDRLFSSLAAGGALLLHQKVKKMTELTGLKNGVHYVEWKDIDDLKEKIIYYLKHEDERKKIASTGTKFCRRNHSFDSRVKELESFLKEIPEKGNTISSLIICKNEINNIEETINQVEPFSNEIVVLDTGSTDGTQEKLVELKRKNEKLVISKTEWKNDFSLARNHAKLLCKYEWVFWVDCDDRLTKKSIGHLKRFVKGEWKTDLEKYGVYNPSAFQFRITDSTSGQSLSQTRLFRNRPDVVWENKLHETVDNSLERLGIVSHETFSVMITHQRTNDAKKIMDKHIRNIKILEKEKDSEWKYYWLAQSLSAMGKWADAILIYQAMLEEYKIENKDLVDFINFAIGFCYKQIGMVKYAHKYISKSQYIDSFFLQAAMEGFDKRPDLLKKFLEALIPSDYPSYAEQWRDKARTSLIEYYEKELTLLKGDK